MAKEMKLPELGENIEAAEVIAVLVAEGDSVEADQPILELETDKATAEVPAAFAGVVKTVHVKKGDQVKVGQVLITVDDAGSAATAPAKRRKPAAGKEGRKETPEPADKPESAAPPSGQEKPAADAEEARTDTPAADKGAGGEDQARRHEEERQRFREKQSGPAAASPAVRRLARELGIDVEEVPGSGTGGRISEEDVMAFARRLIATGGPGAARHPAAGRTAAAGPALPDFSRWGEVERHSMSGIRRKTAEHMAHAWATIPHVTQFDRADITDVEAFRLQYGERVSRAGGKLTVTAILVKLAAAALGKFPRFNASLDLDSEEILYKKFVHIGVAVDTERGLLVPVLRDVDRKSLTEVAVEMSELADKARNRKVAADDLQGGGFTVTNLGGLGTTYFSPIVNWPEVAILGVGRARPEPVLVDEEEFEARLILPLSLSYDHRVIDGADAARFLRWLAEALENPLLLTLEG